MDGASGTVDAPKTGKRIEQQIEEIKIGFLGLLSGMGKLAGNFDQFDGMIIQTNAPGLVDAICRAARQNSSMRGWCLSVVHVSAYSDIALYASMMIVPILLNHGLLPMSLFSSGETPENDNTNGVYSEN